MIKFIQNWRAKRAARKAAALIEKLCDEMPISFFENLVYDAKTNKPLESIDALNAIYRVAQRIKNQI
jgi:hypothetical protein